MDKFTRLTATACPLDIANLNTDQIIPARFLKRARASGFGEALLHDLRFDAQGRARPDFPLNRPAWRGARIIVGGRNFGCGSSREHAPIALAAAGIQAVVAEFYARIFFRNSVNGGYLIPFESPERLCEKICTGDLLSIDVAGGMLHNRTTGEQWKLKPLGEVAPIIDAGGIFPYAKSVGMLK